MPISKDLLDILVCPLDKAELEMKPDQSGLKCTQCKRVYPIRDDIPVMLIDEATALSEQEAKRLDGLESEVVKTGIGRAS